MHTIRSVRRNRVNERSAVLIAGLGGLAAVFAGASPTGLTAVDAVLVFAGATATAWASASAPWWSVAGACGLAAAIAIDPPVAVVGALGFVVGLGVGIRRRDNAELRAVAGAVAVNTFIRSELEGFVGLSAIVGIVTCGLLLLVGLARRKSSIRRPAWVALASVGGVGILAILGLALAASGARPDVSDGADAAQRALDALDAGEYQSAARLFDDAAASFQAASDSLGGALALPSRAVPVLSQNVRAGDEIAETAASSLRLAAGALREIDPSELAVRNGALSIEAVEAVEAPLVQVQAALDDLEDATSAVRSPWLIGPIQRELDELDEDLARQEPRLANAVDAARVAPGVLGADGQRRYLVLYTSPAEARGLGGFVGNYAEVVIDNGRISVTDFDRRSDLEDAVRGADVRCDECPREFIEVYGRYGFTTGTNGGVGDRGWSNITMPAHFPHVAEAAQQLYPQSGGQAIDGVMVMDPYVVQALMRYTGPIEVNELGVTVRPAEAADFILREQYVLDGANPDRIDALETLGTEVITRLLTADLPEPVELADVFAPLISERRLLMWTDDAEEQDLFERIGLLGSLPELDAAGGFSVSVTNAGASKIDVFLDRTVDVELIEGQLVARVELANTAPSSGLPRYVIGNSVGLPEGSSRLIVAFYGPAGIDGVLRDGSPIEVAPQQEAGWFRYSTSVDLLAGESTTFELTFSLPDLALDVGEPPPSVDGPVVFEQPLARP